MAMAYWNGMTWGVSTKEIAFLESFTTSFGIETSTNADKEGESPTEKVAKSLVEFSMSTTYQVETGTTDVLGKIEEWKKQIGKAAPLILGSKIFGPEKVQLQNVGVSNTRISPNGVLYGATLTFSFKEMAEEKTSGVTTTTSGSGGSSASGSRASSRPSAKNVTASSSDKASKKPDIKGVHKGSNGRGAVSYTVN